MSKTWTFSSIFKLSRKPLTDLSGHDIGRYHIIEKLGMGGMAVVYSAFDRQLQRDVAIKIIRIDDFAPPVMARMRKRFEREAQSLAQMDHPNIIPIYDYGEFDKAPFLVMKFIRGGALKDHTGSGPFAFNEAAHLLAPVAHALGYAHSRDIIHRDVKPANILINEAGVPLLSDFGVAKILETEEGHTLTMDNVAVGTPEYMAPEQWENDISPQTDVYALGVVLYELVTGHKPYTADTPAAVHRKVLTDPLIRPRQWVMGLPDEVEAVIFKAMARRKEDRYADMDKFAADLEKLAVSVMNPQYSRVKILNRLSVLRTHEALAIDSEQVAPKRPSRLLKTLKYPHPARLIDRINNFGIFRVIFVLIALLAGLAIIGIVPDIKSSGSQISTNTTATSLNALAGTVIVERTAEAGAAMGENNARTLPATQKKTEVDSTLTAVVTPTLGIGETRVIDDKVQVFVPAGQFRMGSEKGYSDESPVHAVFLNDFWIDQTEVTNDEFLTCVIEEECVGQFGFNAVDYLHPATYMTWDQADAYCRWAGKRLPTEAEWEKAARGTDDRLYPWGDDEVKSYLTNMGNSGIANVGNNPKNVSPYGAFDLAGNAMEWVADWYSESYYEDSPTNNPRGPDNGKYRIIRGGSWENDWPALRVFSRFQKHPSVKGSTIGFRCVSDS